MSDRADPFPPHFPGQEMFLKTSFPKWSVKFLSITTRIGMMLFLKITSKLARCESAKHMMKTQMNDSRSYSFCVAVSHCAWSRDSNSL